ncbi:hypothetical protein LRP88_01937 [Fusarium phalaenopsidis]
MYQGVVVDKFGQDYFDNLPVDFWLTVPATWSDTAKQLTIDAARDAGFASRPHDRVRLIAEPEAAAHLALRSSIQHVQDLIEVGARVMVCDLGGGTVDITSYEVQSISPRLKLRELCVGGGGKCGGTFVDRNFHAHMEKHFGEAFTSLDPEITGPGSRFMDQFEMAKRDFSLNQPKTRPHRLHLPMESLRLSLESKKHYDSRFGYVLITQEDMKSLFDPVGDKIICLVADQVNRLKKETSKAIDHLVLVGGFGSSPYIKERLKEWCLAQHIRMTTPWSGAWSAVNDILQADWNVSHRLKVEGASPKLDSSVALFACSLDEAPDTIESDDVEYVGSIDFVLDNLDLSTVKEKRIDGGQIKYRLGLTYNLRVSDEDGLFDIKIFYQGKECGQGKIIFSYSVE